MYDIFFGQNAGIFTVPAIIGTFFFVLRMSLMLVGGDDGGDFGVDADPGALDAADATDSDHAFQVVSTQTIAAFMMGAGWAGFGAYRGSGLDLGWSLAVAAGGGISMAWLVIWMMRVVFALRDSGNVSIQQAIGRDAEVYVRVPGARAGPGRVRVVIDDRMRMYTAVTDGEELERGSTVQVTRINPDNTVTVARR